MNQQLHGRLFTVKKTHRMFELMDSKRTHENKRKRKDYLQKLKELIEEEKDIIWIDETNFNLLYRCSFGRSHRRTRATSILPASRDPNLPVLGAISCQRVVKRTHRRGSFKATDCKLWMQRLLEEHNATGNDISNLFVVFDTLSP